VKSYRKELWFETPGRRAFLNITPQVEVTLKESGVREGLALINAMHITASVFINDDERGLHAAARCAPAISVTLVSRAENRPPVLRRRPGLERMPADLGKLTTQPGCVDLVAHALEPFVHGY
jgi:hypothetical protein